MRVVARVQLGSDHLRTVLSKRCQVGEYAALARHDRPEISTGRCETNTLEIDFIQKERPSMCCLARMVKFTSITTDGTHYRIPLLSI